MERNDDMIIRFSGLKPGVYAYDFTLTNDFLLSQKNEEIAGGNVDIHAKMDRKDRMLMFYFDITGELVTWCDRCLGQLSVPIAGEEELCVRMSDEEESSDENVMILPEKAFEIDLAPYLYEIVAVRLPMRHVHPEGECDAVVASMIYDGSQEDENSGTDSRWDALKGLIGNDSDTTNNEINK